MDGDIPGGIRGHHTVLCREATWMGTFWGDTGTCHSALWGRNMDGDILGRHGDTQLCFVGNGTWMGTSWGDTQGHMVRLCQEAAGRGASWGHTGTSWGHTGTPHTSRQLQGPKCQRGTTLLPRVGMRRGHGTVIIALQDQPQGGGQAGDPASDLGFKGLSPGTVTPQHSLCRGSPPQPGAVGDVSWGQGP